MNNTMSDDSTGITWLNVYLKSRARNSTIGNCGLDSIRLK